MDNKSMYEFYVAGVKFHELHKCINELDEGMYLNLVPEPTNQYDPNAVQIIYSNENEDKNSMLGYVPAKISALVTADLEISDLECKIIELNPSEKPWKQLKVLIKEVEEDV